MTLGDTPDRDYGWKLDAFWAMAEPDVRPLLAAVAPGARVLDAGCGTGAVAQWFAAEGREVRCVDLSEPHVAVAVQRGLDASVGDIAALDDPDASYDAVWCANTLHHLDDRDAGLAELIRVLRPGGTVAVAQTGFVPDMVFAWDPRLERLVNDACRMHYAVRYGLDNEALSAPRDLVGLFHRAGLADVRARTVSIERTAPLDEVSRRWLQDVLFDGHWRGKVDDHLDADDLQALHRLIDVGSREHCLDRTDMHHLQTLTIVTGVRV